MGGSGLVLVWMGQGAVSRVRAPWMRQTLMKAESTAPSALAVPGFWAKEKARNGGGDLGGRSQGRVVSTSACRPHHPLSNQRRTAACLTTRPAAQPRKSTSAPGDRGPRRAGLTPEAPLRLAGRREASHHVCRPSRFVVMALVPVCAGPAEETVQRTGPRRLFSRRKTRFSAPRRRQGSRAQFRGCRSAPDVRCWV